MIVLAHKRKGFTLAELMVVIALLAVLATLIAGAVQIATKATMYMYARSEMRDIKMVFESYLIKKGELPPSKGSPLSSNGDFCDGCRFNAGNSRWNELLDELVELRYMDSDLADRSLHDPWGNYYVYDDNYGQGLDYSTLCTAGPDGKMGNGGTGSSDWWHSGDDECLDFQHSKVCLWTSPNCP